MTFDSHKTWTADAGQYDEQAYRVSSQSDSVCSSSDCSKLTSREVREFVRGMEKPNSPQTWDSKNEETVASSRCHELAVEPPDVCLMQLSN